MPTQISMLRGDGRSVTITPSDDVSAATSLIFTAKLNKSQTDLESVFQKTLGAGLAVNEAGKIIFTPYHTDTKNMTAKTLVWDIQAQWPGSEPLTVADGTLVISADVTRELDTSVPINTVSPSATQSAIAAAAQAVAAAEAINAFDVAQATASAAAAATSADAATTSATNAAGSAATAGTSATNAATSADTATNAADAAATSETNAGNSASAASTSASNAATSATAAADSASAAAAALTSKADIASPTFTGTPSAPTATLGTNTNQIATTEFVADAIEEIGTGNMETVSATAHGFTEGQGVYKSGSAWAKARANAAATTTAVGVVQSAPDANTFVIVREGPITLPGASLTPGATYYLSDVTAGLLTATAPTSESSFLAPVLYAVTSTTGYVKIGPPQSLALIALTDLATQAPGTVVANLTGGSAGPTATLATSLPINDATQAALDLKADAEDLEEAVEELEDAIAAVDTGGGTGIPTNGLLPWPRSLEASLPAGFLPCNGAEGTPTIADTSSGLVMWLQRTTGLPPQIVSLTVLDDGATLEAVFDEAVELGVNGIDGLALTLTGGAVGLTYTSGDGTDTLLIALDRTIDPAETGTGTFTPPTDGIKDLHGNLLEAFTGETVVNDSAATGYLFSDNLEHANSTDALAAGITTNNAVTWNYTTSPAPLQGSRSIRMSASTANIEIHFDDPALSIPDQDEVWLYFMVNTSTTASSTLECTFRNSGAAVIGTGSFISTGIVRAAISGADGNSEAILIANTTYHVWMHYVRGSGSNARLHIYVSTDGVKPVEATAEKTTGNATTAIRSIRLRTSSANGIIFDKIRISASEIGDNPS